MISSSPEQTVPYNRPLQIVIVDDDPVFREFARLAMSEGTRFEVIEASNRDELLSIMASKQLDCIVLDYELRDETGLSINAALNERFADPPPVVMLTGAGNERTAMKAWRSGISDYVSKHNFSREELLRAVWGAAQEKAQERSQKAATERLIRMSAFNELTGLFTLDKMHDRADRLDARVSAVTPLRYALLIITANGLGQWVNDLGQVMGDRIIRAFSAKLKEVARPQDVVGHYEGNDFLYIVDTDVTAASVRALADKILSGLSFEVHFEATNLQLSASIGLATYPLDGATSQQVLQAARKAVSEAKENTASLVIASGSSAELISEKVDVAMPLAASPSAGTAERHLAADGQTLTDRRRHRRQRIFKPGQILFKNSVIDCAIRDVSEGGARLRLQDHFAVPETFELSFVGTGERRRVRARWQIGKEVGVEFL